MSKREPGLYLMDILISILKIEHHTKKFSTPAELKNSYTDWDITLLAYERIGEATKKLIDEGFFTSNKRPIVNLRNIITHAYFGIDEEEIFQITQEFLPKLKSEVLEKLLVLPDVQLLFLSTINDYQHIDYIVQELKLLLERIQ